MAEDDTHADQTQSPASSPATPPLTDPWTPLGALGHEIDRMYDDFDLGSRNRGGRRWGMLPMRGAQSPASDLVESEDGYQLSMELPGLSESDVELKVKDGLISLRGQKTEERKEERRIKVTKG